MPWTIGHGEKKSPKETQGPLRKIVSTFTDDKTLLPYEVLECGHKLLQKSDIYGRTNAYRRRCWKCRAGREADVQLGENHV